MGVWDSLLKRIVNPIVNEEVKKLEQIKLRQKDDLEKKLFLQAPNWNSFPTGASGAVNKQFPRSVTFNNLREFSYFYPILRSCINYRKRQITQLDWDIVSKNVLINENEKKQIKKRIKELKDFFRYPTGDKTISFRTFISKFLEDTIVLDAGVLYRQKNRGGSIYGYRPVDGATIEIILNEDGSTPNPPNAAYQQKIDGQVVNDKLTTDDLIYKIMNPRTDTPYGLSLVEHLILTVSTALKLQAYDLSALSDGNVPEGFVELPKEVASDPKQLKAWQEAWDVMFSGNPQFQRKIKFLPEGMKWTPTRKPEDIEYQKFNQWLLLCTASIMEVSPQTIGFQMERGKGATETEWEIGKERGLYPLANFLKEIFDQIIQEDFGEEELEFSWTNINPTNKAEEAKVFDVLVRSGAVSVDEWRVGEGLDPIGCSHYVMTPVGPIFVKDLVKQSEAGTPILPGQPPLKQPGQGPTTPAKEIPEEKIKEVSGEKTKEKKEKEIEPAQKIVEKVEKLVYPVFIKDKQNNKQEDEQNDESAKNSSVIVDELKRWKRASANDLKGNRAFRNFQTEIIDERTQGLIKSGLQTVKKKEELDQLFDPFISQENQILTSVMELYDQINLIEKNSLQDEAN